MTEKEEMGIAFFVSYGYTEGRIDNVKWRVDMEHASTKGVAARLINQGEHYGSNPEWELTINIVK